jgi:ribosomal protein S7
MGLKKLKDTFKKKLTNHLIKKGKKQMVEKTITKSLKQAQKQEKKNVGCIIKQSTLNVMPVFRFIKLTNKMRRKKTIKRIPAFLSDNNFRSSWGLKNLTDFSTQKTPHNTLYSKLTDQFLYSSKHLNSLEISGDKSQEEASKEKKYFKYYRW